MPQFNFNLQKISNVNAIRIRSTFNLALFGGMLLVSSNVVADYIGAGIARTNEFSGSSDFTFIPIAAFEISTRIGTFKNDQVGAQLDLIESGAIDTGPVIKINTGRNDSVSDSAVAALPEIKVSPEAGWFIGSGIRLANLGLASNAIVIGRLSVLADVGDGHGGTIVNGSLGLVTPVTDDLRVIPSVSFNYANDDYTQTFYGIENNESSAELPTFTASGGLESTQFALVAIRQLNRKWSVTGIAAYTALQGDAARSPITKRGNDKQLFVGFTANYNF